MSLESWQEEFYPTEASQCSDDKAIQHSLTKWIGLRKENLEKHNMAVSGIKLYERKYRTSQEFYDNLDLMLIGTGTCSLCNIYLGSIQDEGGRCFKCPLYDIGMNKIDCCDEYDFFESEGDPELMIKLLEKALEYERGQQSV